MARGFLTIYVGLSIFIIILNLLANIFTDSTEQFLSSDDWLIFIVACGMLAICEVLEKVNCKSKV